MRITSGAERSIPNKINHRRKEIYMKRELPRAKRDSLLLRLPRDIERSISLKNYHEKQEI